MLHFGLGNGAVPRGSCRMKASPRESEGESEFPHLDKSVLLVRAMQRLSDARMYIDYDDDEFNDLYCTPIRSALHLYLIRIEGKEARHPWADFLLWRFVIESPYEKLYNENQVFQLNGECNVRFIYKQSPPVVQIFKNSELKATFNIYGPTGDVQAQLRALKDYVQRL